MPRHKSKTASKSISKIKTFVKDQKRNVNDLRSKRKARDVSESDSLQNNRKESLESSHSRRRSSESGFRFHLIIILLSLALIIALVGIMLIPIFHRLGNKYLWTSFGGSTLLVILSLLGISSSACTLLSLFTMILQKDAIRKKEIDGWVLIGCFAVSALMGGITVLIAAFQYHDIVEIFGEEFLELLEGYWMTPQFKTGMDRIQIEFECCGFYSYKDWKKVNTLGELPANFIPFSCCSIHVLRPCLHENLPFVQEEEYLDISTLETKLSIYPAGCKLPMEDYYKGLLIWIIFISSALLGMQTILVFLLVMSQRKNSSEYY